MLRLIGAAAGAVTGLLSGLYFHYPDYSWPGFLADIVIGAGIGFLVAHQIAKLDNSFRQNADKEWWQWWKAGFDKTSWKKLNSDIFNPDYKPVEEADDAQEEQSPGADVFTRILATLMAAVAQADGEVSDGEIRKVRKYFIDNFSVSQAEEWVKIFEYQAFQTIDHVSVCKSILGEIDYYARLQLFGILADLAAEDGVVSAEERHILEEIAEALGIEASDQAPAGFKAFHLDAGPYGILGIARSASGDEIKQAYHRLVLQYHPDKVLHLGQNYADAAAEKFRSIHQAYEEIRLQGKIS